MDLKEFRDFITAQRLAEIKEKRSNNLTAMMSVANATISETTRKEN
jgi:ribosome-associated toxin RatA of RatAB toxin-antitoxin module